MSRTDPYSIFELLVNRYLSGELSREEEVRFREALEAEPSLRKELESLNKIWEAAGGMEKPSGYDLDTEWTMLRDQLPGWQEEEGTAGLEKSRGSRSFFFHAYRIAAVLVVGLLFAFALYHIVGGAGTVKVVAENEPVEVFLEDGSEVVLNRNSKLRYPRKFGWQGRKVTLSGEAWFRVARDTVHPFSIDAGTAVVEVLGTRFNVNAYRENPVVEITVESGMVALSPKQDHKEQIVLKAGNSGTYNTRSRELVLVPRSDPNNLSWKTRELYFEHAGLAEVAKVISRVYDVNVEIGNPGMRECPITVTFLDQSLESVLHVLELTMDLEISRSGRTIVLNGGACDQ